MDLNKLLVHFLFLLLELLKLGLKPMVLVLNYNDALRLLLLRLLKIFDNAVSYFECADLLLHQGVNAGGVNEAGTF